MVIPNFDRDGSSELSDEDSDEYQQRQKMKIYKQKMGELIVKPKWYIIKESNVYY